MNIFITDDNPQACARSLDDVRLNKMILETAQMLCTVAYAYSAGAGPMGWCLQLDAERSEHLTDDIIPYKSTHVNHPCTKWVRSSNDALVWTVQHFNALYNEKLYRTGKPHLSYSKLQSMLSQLARTLVIDYDKQLDGPPNPVYAGEYHVRDAGKLDVIKSYRSTMVHKWTDDIAKGRAPTWRGRDIPEWATRVYNGKALVGYEWTGL